MSAYARYGNEKQDSARIRLNEFIASADAREEAGRIPTADTMVCRGGDKKKQPKPSSSDRLVEETRS